MNLNCSKALIWLSLTIFVGPHLLSCTNSEQATQRDRGTEEDLYEDDEALPKKKKKKKVETKKSSSKVGKDDKDDNDNDNKNTEDDEIEDSKDINPSGPFKVERTEISFSGSRGDSVPGYLWVPTDAGSRKRPAILVMYGISGDKDSGSIGTAAQVLAETGFVTMTIDWPGTGGRTPAISKSDRVIKTDVLNWTVADYDRALTFLGEQSLVDKSKLGYVGASMGAMTGLAFASGDSRIKAFSAIVPVINPLWGSKNPTSTIASIDGKNVQCIFTQDNSDKSRDVCSKAKSGSDQVGLPGGHELEGYEGQVVEKVVDFMNSRLVNPD